MRPSEVLHQTGAADGSWVYNVGWWPQLLSFPDYEAVEESSYNSLPFCLSLTALAVLALQ